MLTVVLKVGRSDLLPLGIEKQWNSKVKRPGSNFSNYPAEPDEVLKSRLFTVLACVDTLRGKKYHWQITNRAC
jgi:hypothetical protein